MHTHTHVYQAWANKPMPQYLNDGCGFAGGVLDMEEAGIPTIVGEFSLATDNCAMWLNGFNDNLPGYPLAECHYVDCPKSPIGLPGAPKYMSPNYDKVRSTFYVLRSYLCSATFITYSLPCVIPCSMAFCFVPFYNSDRGLGAEERKMSD
jgi:hypothetical protein